MCDREPWFSEYPQLLERAGSDHYISERTNEALTFARVTGKNNSLKWVVEIHENLPMYQCHEFGDRVKQAICAILEEMYLEEYSAEYNEAQTKIEAEAFIELAE